MVDVPATYADVDDLIQEVGFKPSTPIEVGIPRFVQWYREFYKVQAEEASADEWTKAGLDCFRLGPEPIGSAVSLSFTRLRNLSRPELRSNGTSNSARRPPSAGRFSSATAGAPNGSDARSSSSARLLRDILEKRPPPRIRSV